MVAAYFVTITLLTVDAAGKLVLMGKALVVVVGVAIFVYALFDLIATPGAKARFIPKPIWFLALLVVPVGPLLWIFFGQSSAPPGPSLPPARPRPSAKGPDDDPDYLRGL